MSVKCLCGERKREEEDICIFCQEERALTRFGMARPLKLAGVDIRMADTVSNLYLNKKIGKGVEQEVFLAKRFGKSLFMHGQPGCGKSCTSAGILYHHMLEGCKKKIKRARGPQTFLFLSYPNMLKEIRKAATGSPEEQVKLDKKYMETDLLVIDDYGVEKLTDFSYVSMYVILNHRYGNYKQTIFTSNFSLDQIAEKLGDERIPRRIADWCEVISMGMK